MRLNLDACITDMMIRKLKSGEFRLYSRKKGAVRSLAQRARRARTVRARGKA